MKANIFLGKGQFEMREIPDTQPGAFEVTIKVMAAGICGTDVHIFHGEPGSAEVVPPIVLGHEYAGIVTEIGSGVSTVRVGDKVTVDPNIYCGLCNPCRMGRKQNCQNLSALGVTRNGGFAEYCTMPEAQVFKVRDDIDFDVAAMAEPLACAIHGIDRANIQMGQNVAIIGGGAIGLIMAQLALYSGAGSVVLSEPIEMRRKIGVELGVTSAIDPVNENLLERYAELTGRIGADVVIECVGKPKAVSQAIELAGPGGTVVIFSVPSLGATVPLPLTDVFKKELKILGSFINPDTHQRAVNIINAGKLEIKRLITHTYPLECVGQAIQTQMSDESIKVMVHPFFDGIN